MYKTTDPVYLYDGSFEGLLSAIFETYRSKTEPLRFVREYEWTDSLFSETISVASNDEWARRIREGMIQRTSEKAFRMLYRCFHSEQEDVELLIYRFIDLSVKSDFNIEHNYTDDTVLGLQKIDKMMGREIHRMHAFVRFQRSPEDLYWSVIDPDFNVLPLITDHFLKRYPAQDWLIYDSRRHYGKYFDQHQLDTITFDEQAHQKLRKLTPDLSPEEEMDYQQLWRSYFKATNIPARRNMKLHLQHVPRRYWKYLTEK